MIKVLVSLMKSILTVASNVSSVKANWKSTLAVITDLLSRIKAQAEKATSNKVKEEELRREKEQLELETELAATSAKVNVLEIHSSAFSKSKCVEP